MSIYGVCRLWHKMRNITTYLCHIIQHKMQFPCWVHAMSSPVKRSSHLRKYGNMEKKCKEQQGNKFRWLCYITFSWVQSYRAIEKTIFSLWMTLKPKDFQLNLPRKRGWWMNWGDIINIYNFIVLSADLNTYTVVLCTTCLTKPKLRLNILTIWGKAMKAIQLVIFGHLTLLSLFILGHILMF